MKALSFLEMYKLPYSELHIYYEYLGIKNHNLGFIFDILNRPFSPEMITKYFEGWKISEINSEESEWHEKINLRYGNKDKDWAMIEYWYSKDINHFVYISYGILNNFIVDEHKFLFPRTLDDFINDANRAGITLYWKVKE